MTHWHRRTPKPIAEQMTEKGVVRKHACTTEGCTWAVYIPPLGPEWYSDGPKVIVDDVRGVPMKVDLTTGEIEEDGL